MMLLSLTLLLPLVLLLGAVWRPWRERLVWVLLPAALPALALALLADDALSLSLPSLLTGLEFGLDGLRRYFLLLGALLWVLAGGFATAYLRTDERRGRFAVFWLLTMTGNLGLILAFDLVGFYTAFVLMTFSGYGLVVHTATPEAIRAGRIYLVMAVLGEGALLAGLFHAAALSDSLLLSDIRQTIAAAGAPNLIISMLLLGFGVKAGMALLHFWLPLAHPVAPTPASAVLSGVMIKAGLLGWILFLPFGELALPGWGGLMIAVGVLGSLGAAFVGVTQDSPKTILAYSSISQMGLMLILLGVALAVPDAAPALLVGVAFYALHHGLAKGALFMSTAVMPTTSGWPRHALWLAVVWPGLALMGAPLSSGASAKIAVKSALPESLPDVFLGDWVKPLLSVGAIATTVLVMHLLMVLRDQKKAGSTERALSAFWLLTVGSGALLLWFTPWPEALPMHSGLNSGDAAELLWPMAVGVVLYGLWLGSGVRLRIPAADLLVLPEAVMRVLARRVSQARRGGRLFEDWLIDRVHRLGERVLAGQPSLERLERAMRRQSAALFMLILLIFSAIAVAVLLL